MKYIKQYESIREDIKRGDLIIYEEGRNYNSYVYLVLNDLHRNKRKIDVYCIGYFQFESFTITGINDYNFEYGRHSIYKGEHLSLLDESEKFKIVVDIYNRIILDKNIYYEEKINTIKEKTGIDLREMKEYIEYADKMEMEKNAKKYNI